MTTAPDEKSYVEIPFIDQLKGLGWEHIEGDIMGDAYGGRWFPIQLKLTHRGRQAHPRQRHG